MKSGRKSAAAPPSARKAVLPIEERVAQLVARERTVTSEIVRLEKGRAGSSAPVADDIDTEAIVLLGDAVTPTSRPANAPIVSLQGLHHERRVLNRAIDLGRSMAQHARNELVRGELVARMDEWRSLIRSTAVAVIQLRDLNRDRAKFRSELMNSSGPPSLPCDGFKLLGVGNVTGDEMYCFLQDVERGGIMTKREIDDV